MRFIAYERNGRRDLAVAIKSRDEIRAKVTSLRERVLKEFEQARF